jgi:hypothetical protein
LPGPAGRQVGSKDMIIQFIGWMIGGVMVIIARIMLEERVTSGEVVEA